MQGRKMMITNINTVRRWVASVANIFLESNGPINVRWLA